MNVKKLIAIVFIWIVATAGWMTLAGTITTRTGDKDEKLNEKVVRLWGSPQAQKEPRAAVLRSAGLAAAALAQPTRAPSPSPADLVPIASSAVAVEIRADNRSCGLMWFPVYTVAFTGRYTIRNDSDNPQAYTVHFTPPQSSAEFSKQQVSVNGQPLPQWGTDVVTPLVEPNQSVEVAFSYESAGTQRWTYELPPAEMINDLTLTMKIDSPDYDFREGSSPATARDVLPGPDGMYTLVWTKQKVSNARDIAVDMPRRQQPGPLAARISAFAPVSLFFFFVVMVTIQIVRKLEFHPMHYLFLAAAFFAFHLLLAYLVDHVNLHLSFWISAAVSIFLAILYLSLVAGPRAGVAYAAFSQLVYLVLFSYSFFLEGWTGLTITIGSILTLAVLMVLTAKVRWGESMTELEPRRRAAMAPIMPVAAPPAADEPPRFAGERTAPPDRPPAPRAG